MSFPLALGLMPQSGSSLSGWTPPLFWASSLRLGLPCKTGSPLPSFCTSSLRLDLPCQPGPSLHSGLPLSERPPLSDWILPPSFLAFSLRLHLPLQNWIPRFILGLPSQTGSPFHSGPPPPDWASPDCKMTVADTYMDLPTRASAREGCTPFSKT